MPPRKRSTSGPDTAAVEAVLLDLVRLAARDDAAAIVRRVRRWLGTPDARRALSDPVRADLLGALDAPPERPLRVRRATTVARPPGAPSAGPHVPTGTPHDGPRPVLAAPAQAILDRIVSEYERRDDLARHGLVPTRTLLLSGPPGVGKTMTATWLATRLGLPLVSIEPADVMTSLLGESARNLVTALEEARRSPSVVLLDELDAFGKSRDDSLDVGELKRLVTTLLVELDRWPPGNLLIGATNHPGILDHALERRFEARLMLGPPGPDERREILAALLRDHDVAVDPAALTALVHVTDGRTGSDVRTAALRAVRAAVLTGDRPEMALLREALPDDPDAMSRTAKVAFAGIASSVAGLPHRQIGPLLGISHTAAGRLVRAAEAQRAA